MKYCKASFLSPGSSSESNIRRIVYTNCDHLTGRLRVAIFGALRISALFLLCVIWSARATAFELVPSLNGGSLNSIAFSPDNKYLASASEDGAKLWDVDSGRLIRVFFQKMGAHNRADWVSFSPDGKRLLSAWGGQISIWDPVSGELTKQWDTGRVRISLSLSPDGRRFAMVERTTSQAKELLKPSPEFPFPRIRSNSTKYVTVRNVDTGELISTLFQGTKEAEAVAFTRDGNAVAVFSSDGRFDVVDVETKQLRGSMQLGEKAWFQSAETSMAYSLSANAFVFTRNRGIAFIDPDKSEVRTFNAGGTPRYPAISTDGKLLVVGGSSVSTWEVLGATRLREYAEGAGAVAISSDGALVASSDATGKLILLEASSGAKLKTFVSFVPVQQKSAAVANKGDWAAIGYDDNRIRFWNLRTGQPERSIDVTEEADKLEFSRDDTLLTTGDKIWSVANGRAILERKNVEDSFHHFSPSGRELVGTNFQDKVARWSIKTGQLIDARRAHPINPERSIDTVLSPDGRFIASTDGRHTRLWDVELSKSLWSIDEGEWPIFSQNAAQFFDGKNLRDTRTRKVLKTFARGGSEAAFSLDGKRLLLEDRHGSGLVLWDFDSEVEEQIGRHDGVSLIRFLANDSRAITISGDGQVKIWDLREKSLLATMVMVGRDDWITMTPEGFFVSSDGARDVLSVVRGLELLAVNQFYQALYRPDLVREKLAGDPRGLVRYGAAELNLDRLFASGSAPGVRLTIPGRSAGSGTVAGDAIAIQAEIIDRGGGIGRIEWRVNRVTVGIDTSPPTSVGQSVNISRSFRLDPGDNTIEVVAYNSANLIASVPSRITVTVRVASPSIVPSQPAAPSTVPAPSSAVKPRLFVLVAGVDDYADKRFQLKYSVADAKEIARGFRDASGALYRSVEVKLMTDAEVTKDKLHLAFAEMAEKVSESDVFVLYLAGHGKTLAGRYYFAPQDFRVPGKVTDKPTDEQIIAAVRKIGISQDQWQLWLASILARKSVILFDTCESGTLIDDETQKLERVAANERLSQAIGRSILTASGSSEKAWEGYRGHGLFTYLVLDAIYQADGDRNGTIELNELAAYVYGQVVELSKKEFKARQEPQMKITANYPLTMQTRILRDEVVPVAEAKPTYQLAQTTQLQIQPSFGATVVRSLSAKTPVTVLESRNGWSLIAEQGRPLGYVATRDLAPLR